MTNLRARDIDRVNCGIALDAAYADGQLNFDEHTLRQNTCNAGKTVDDLRALVADLQVTADLPESVAAPIPTTHTRRRVVYVVAVSVVLAAGIGAWLTFAGNPSPPVAVVAPVDNIVPIVAPHVDFTTVDGLTRFIGLWKSKFGDTAADSLTFFPVANYAVITRATEPGREQSYVFHGGFSKMSGEAAGRSDVVVDLGGLDIGALVGAMNAVPDTLRVPDAVIGSVQYGPDSQTVQIYAANAAGAGGSISLTPAGAQLKVYSSAF